MAPVRAEPRRGLGRCGLGEIVHRRDIAGRRCAGDGPASIRDSQCCHPGLRSGAATRDPRADSGVSGGRGVRGLFPGRAGRKGVPCDDTGGRRAGHSARGGRGGGAAHRRVRCLRHHQAHEEPECRRAFHHPRRADRAGRRDLPAGRDAGGRDGPCGHPLPAVPAGRRGPGRGRHQHRGRAAYHHRPLLGQLEPGRSALVFHERATPE